MTPLLLLIYILMASIGLLCVGTVAAIIYAGFYLLRLNLIGMTTPKDDK